MTPDEIRALRGSLSRGAFARLLGITPLTVLRWELSEDNKDAHRPRAKMLERLRKLAAQSSGAPLSVLSPEFRGDEDEDGAFESIAIEERPRTAATPADDGTEQALIGPLLEQLMGEAWRSAESELLRLVAGNRLHTLEGRALATLGLIQAQLIGRLDVRGALMALVPVLDEAERGSLSEPLAGRAHTLAALLYSAPDSPFFDMGRVNAHAGKAEALLDDTADGWRVLLATARIAAARFLGPSVFLHAYQSEVDSLQRARAPLTRFFAEALHAGVASHRGDTASAERHWSKVRDIAEQLQLWPAMVALMADRVWRGVRGSELPEQVLEITQYVRRRARENDVGPSEPLLRVMACEIEVLGRTARFEEANALLEEAQALAKRGGLSRYALAVPTFRLLLYTNRCEQLESLADGFEAEVAGSNRPLADVHALLVRGALASLRGDAEGGAELLDRVCRAAETTLGIGYVAHDAHYEYVLTQLVLHDRAGTQAALARAQAYVLEHPSLWHTAIYQRLEAFALLAQGQYLEARQKIETTAVTFELLGDVVQLAFTRAALAMVARHSGAPDAERRLESALAELRSLGAWSPQLLSRAQVISSPPPTEGWREQTLMERLAGAIDRLAVRGLSQHQQRRSLQLILGELFPGREVVIRSAAASDNEPRSLAVNELSDAGQLVRIGAAGELKSDELAALRVLAAFLPRAFASGYEADPEPAIDNVLPGFIAAAPLGRKLKAEISRLSHSSATVLITGESGSGKEVVAHAVHELSTRAGRPYVVFNCASVPRELFEGQLFGHRKGAFTGALSDSPGVIRAADGGTLFLDEIGELPLDTQPKLLRFLENGEVFPLGEQKPQRVDVRVLAATHRELDRLVREGLFREDLYYRLNVVPLKVPPLRERKQDVSALARLFIARLSPPGGATPELAADAVRALEQHDWPGNVRELRNVIERAMAYTPVPSVLYAAHLRLGGG